MLADLVTDTAEKHKQSDAMVVSTRDFTFFSLLNLENAVGLYLMLKAAGIPVNRYNSPATLAVFLVEFIFSHF
jgi:hypothetical protein